MTTKSIWGEEAVSQLEQATSEDTQENPTEQIQEPTKEEAEKIQEDTVFELDKKETNSIFNARLRLEQGKLYEMLINHNIFEGVDANPQAIQNVQEELKGFIIERLEILLGIRNPQKMIQSTDIKIELPFNDLEIEFLKALAYTGTKGESVKGNPVEAKSTELKPLVSAPITKTKIMPLTKPRSLSTYKKDPPPSTEKVVLKKRTTVQNTPKVVSPTAPRPLTVEEAELLAREELKATSDRKPWVEMTEAEKVEEIKKVNARYKKVKTLEQIPIPTTDDLQIKFMTERANKNGGTDRLNQLITNIVMKNKNDNSQEVYND